MLVRKRVKLLNGCVNALSPEIESPIKEFASMFIDIRVFDDDRPGSYAGFSPGSCQHLSVTSTFVTYQ